MAFKCDDCIFRCNYYFVSGKPGLNSFSMPEVRGISCFSFNPPLNFPLNLR